MASRSFDVPMLIPWDLKMDWFANVSTLDDVPLVPRCFNVDAIVITFKFGTGTSASVGVNSYRPHG
jgi:hypothetical protein